MGSQLDKSLEAKLYITSNAATTPPYVYTPIDSKNEIRILVLLPPASPHLEKLHGELITANLADKPSYEAVSYCWGDPVFSESLHLPEGTIQITESLATGLRLFRHANASSLAALPTFPSDDGKRRIWVDAVCINQEDDLEKGHQVTLMGQVYRNAKCVLGWLGIGTPKTDSAILNLHDLSRVAEQIIPGPDPLTAVKSFNFTKVPNVVDILRDILGSLDNESLRAFFGQPWFCRLWILQEVVLAKEVAIYNGQNKLGFDILARAVAVLYLCSRLPSLPNGWGKRKTIIDAFNIGYRRESYWGKNGGGNDLLGTIKSHRNRHCKLDHDRVYALLGLMSKAAPVDIDYNLSVEEVYTRLALVFFKQGKLDILHYLEKRNPNKFHQHSEQLPENQLPSWVPDWRSSSQNWRIDELHGFSSATSAIPIINTKRTSFGVLGIRGIQIDALKLATSRSTGLSAEETCTRRDTSNRALHTLRFREIVSRHLQADYPTGEALEFAFARMVLLDNLSLKSARILGNDLTLHDLYDRWLQYKDLRQQNPVKSSKDTLGLSEGNSLARQDLKMEVYEAAILKVMHKKCFILTESGYFGIGNWWAKPGDIVAVFEGAQIPSILRKVEHSSHDVGDEVHNEDCNENGIKEKWEIIGQCYLHGFMNNEALQPEYDDKRQWFWIA